MEFSKEIDNKTMISQLNELSTRYGTADISYIGESILSKPIPLITLGDKNAKKSVLYVATHHASENICTSLLMNFIEEYLILYTTKRQIYGINIPFLYKMRKIFIVPMLNPDGVDYRLSGVSDENPIKERVISYNAGSENFSKWNSNARGVDLNHNYDAYFDEYKKIESREQISAGPTRFSGEAAESEPECSALCNFIRFNSENLDGILTLHTQGEEIYYKSRGIAPPKAEHICKILSRMTSYKMSEAEGLASYGGLTDWFIKEYSKPSFTIECGKGTNPLDPMQTLPIYTRLREALFTFPILF